MDIYTILGGGGNGVEQKVVEVVASSGKLVAASAEERVGVIDSAGDESTHALANTTLFSADDLATGAPIPF